MADIRIIKHEAVPKCGNFEVRYSDGRPGRRLRQDLITREVALEQAKAVARAVHERSG
jgi:hypothetical protein